MVVHTLITAQGKVGEFKTNLTSVVPGQSELQSESLAHKARSESWVQTQVTGSLLFKQC